VDGDRDELPPLLGLLGIARRAGSAHGRDQRDAVWLLADRAALALEDRQLQQRVFRSLEDLQPQIDMLQHMRAMGRYDSSASLLTEPLPRENDLADWVKDALTHYWGGPKLTNSPLMKLRIVQMLAEDHEGNTANALRALLRKAVDQIKPEGERRFTSEWILYNILEMKFIEGRKVREVAGRLAMSEADLYRKQRVAVEAVARAILDMEQNEVIKLGDTYDSQKQYTKRKYENAMPTTDEGWWESVLAEERLHAPSRRRSWQPSPSLLSRRGLNRSRQMNRSR
jgi:hypothetical protein